MSTWKPEIHLDNTCLKIISYLTENTSPPLFVIDMFLHSSSIFIKAIIVSVYFNKLYSYVHARANGATEVTPCFPLQKHYHGGVGTGKTDSDKLPCNDTYNLPHSDPSPHRWTTNPITDGVSFHSTHIYLKKKVKLLHPIAYTVMAHFYLKKIVSSSQILNQSNNVKSEGFWKQIAEDAYC